MGMDDHEHDDSAQACPYCTGTELRDHVLLVVDRTFRTAESGVLMEAFDERWSRLCENSSDDFNEREAFEELLYQVDSCADSSHDYDHEDILGMSVSYSIYYIAPAEKADAAMACLISYANQAAKEKANNLPLIDIEQVLLEARQNNRVCPQPDA